MDGTITYDTVQINTFLETVFHTERPKTEHIFVQASTTAPKGYGTDVTPMLAKLKDSKVPLLCYFGTSTITSTENKRRFKRDAFCEMAVIVLDDIGTKIPLEKVKDLDATYIIETSEGNFQYGLVLDEPITDYDEAMLILQTVADAGFTDKGGCMPCKKVRLPCGVNGKKDDDKKDFPVTLVHMDGAYWTPQGILSAIGVDVDWEDLREHAATQRAKTKRYGAAAWSKVINYDARGLFDPILEWLYTQDMVVDDSNPDWVEVHCPWLAEHTSGGDTCGYSPVGRGSQPDRRGYNCFHGHCSGRNTEEFLAKIADWGGPHCPVKEPFPELTANYVLDVENDMAWNVRGDFVAGMKTEMLRKTTPDVFLPRLDKAALKANPVPIWMRLPSTVQVHGVTYDPSTTSPIVLDEEQRLRVNTFKLPDWKPLKVDTETIKPFIEFITYLIPTESERNYFLDWLACKVKNPAFRGAGIVMVAHAEGTGRNTLMQMIGKLFGSYNVRGVAMEDVLSSQWTDWRASLFAHVDESMAVSGDGKYRAYDRLKELVDPMTQTVTVNPKHMPQMKVKVATSMMFFSNHEDAIHVAGNTRRFFGIQNAMVPRKPEYFMALRKWMGDYDKVTGWEQHVWNWLKNRPVDLALMNGPAPRSAALGDIIHASKGTLDVIGDAALDIWGPELVCNTKILDLLTGLEEQGLLLPKGWRAVVQRNLTKVTYKVAPDKLAKFRILLDGKQHLFRGKSLNVTIDENARRRETEAMPAYFATLDKRAFCTAVRDWANERGYSL